MTLFDDQFDAVCQHAPQIGQAQHVARRVKNSAELRVGLSTAVVAVWGFDISAEDRQRLAEKAAGIEPETLRQNCVFDPADLLHQIKSPIRQRTVSAR